MFTNQKKLPKVDKEIPNPNKETARTLSVDNCTTRLYSTLIVPCTPDSEDGCIELYTYTYITTCTQTTIYLLDDDPAGWTGNYSDGGHEYPTGGSGSTDQATDPCGKVKNSTDDPKYKSNITSLERTTSQDHENGYRLGTQIPDTNQTGTQNQILQNKPGTREVDMKIFASTFALMHSHYDGLYPIFSPGDILSFNKWIVWAKQYNDNPSTRPKIPLNNLTLTVVTSYGNYLLSFDGTDVAPLPEYTQKQFDYLDKIYIKYLNKGISVGNVSGNVNYDMDTIEKEFMKFIKNEMNMTGLKVFKVENDGNYEMKLDSKNNITKPKCP